MKSTNDSQSMADKCINLGKKHQGLLMTVVSLVLDGLHSGHPAHEVLRKVIKGPVSQAIGVQKFKSVSNLLATLFGNINDDAYMANDTKVTCPKLV